MENIKGWILIIGIICYFIWKYKKKTELKELQKKKQILQEFIDYEGQDLDDEEDDDDDEYL